MSCIPPRIVITGAESTGKTTLARYLAQQLKLHFSPESARHYLDAHLSVNPAFELSVDTVVPIAYTGRATEMWLESLGNRCLICDTDVLSTIVYGRQLYGFESDELELLLSNRPARLYLLLDIDIGWTPDPTPGQRAGIEARVESHRLFLHELEARNLPFELISAAGNTHLRTEKALRIAQSVLNTLS
ncbi:NadR-like protein [bacterium]|nr:MAG: NadR-like protein [bacterium]